METINKKLKDISPVRVNPEAGSAGSVEYDMKTGGLKLTKTLAELPGSKMPLNLKLLYDAAHGGWRLNYEQYLTPKSNISGWTFSQDKPDFIYADGSMEDRYFYAANQIVYENSLSDTGVEAYGYFENETCLNLKQTSTGWKIEDLSGNSLTFDSAYRLTSAKDVYGHTTAITTSAITDGEGNVCNFMRSGDGMTVEIRSYNKRFELTPVTVSGSSGWYMLAEYEAEWDESGGVAQQTCLARSFYLLQSGKLTCAYDGFTSVEATFSGNWATSLVKKEYADYGASGSGTSWTLSFANGETTESYSDFTHTADEKYSFKDKKGIKTEYGLVRYDSNHPDLLKYASITVDGLFNVPDRTVTTNYLVESYVENLGTITDFSVVSIEEEIARLNFNYDNSYITNQNGTAIAGFNLLTQQELTNLFLAMRKGTRCVSVYMNTYCYDTTAMPLKFSGFELKNLAPVVCTDYLDEDGNSRYKTYTVYQADMTGTAAYAIRETTQLVKGNKFYVSYKCYNSKFELVKEKGYDGVEKEYTYDADGLLTCEKAGDASAYVKTDYAFEQKTESGETVYEEKSAFYVDGQERTTRNVYDAKKELKYSEDANGNKTTPVFSNDMLSSVKVNGTEKMSYAYENNRLKALTHNGTKYKFGYGKGCLSSIGYETINSLYSKRIEFVTLSRTTTDDVKTVQYSTDTNSFKERYTYDKNGRLILKEEGTTSFASVKGNGYREAADGGLKPSVLIYSFDSKANLEYHYSYDEHRKHVTQVGVLDGNAAAVKYVKNISYDGYDRVIKENYGTYAIGTEVQYPDSNNSPEERIETLKHTLSGTLDITNYTYDNLKRLTEKEVSAYYSGTIYRNKYSYHAGKSGTNETTGLIKNEELYLRYAQNPTEKYEYAYDANGNVTEVKNLLDTSKNVTYEYDGLNRLVKERNGERGSEWRYTYDNGGNITKKEEYNLSTGALSASWDYGYSDTYWKDQLTSWGSYGTSSFVYDSAGNPTKYKGKTLTWQGKKLVKYANSDLSYMDLSYDGNGMLVGYTQNDTYSDWAGAQFTNTTTKEIVRDGDRIINEKITEYNQLENTTSVKNVKYTYDEKGVSGMTVNNVSYYFVRNIFGDVTAIYDESRNKKAEYRYDAWGTCYMPVNVDGIGSLNPFRYRGYYFVSQIGLYYLTTRFYDYTTGRFLNADVPSICIDDGLEIPEGCNLYSYCLNNPVMCVDPTGHVAISLLLIGFFAGAAIGFGGSVVSQGISNGWDNINWWQAGFDGLIGGISGLIGGSGVGIAGSMISGGILGFSGSVGGDLISNGGDFSKVNWGKAVVMGAFGAIWGAISKEGAGNIKAMNEAINSGKSWGAKTFLNFSASVADRGASIGARETAALFMANAILGYQAKAFTYVFGGMILSSVLSTLI